MQYYYAAWLPNEELELGDVGVLERRLFFRRVTSLKKLKVCFDVRDDPHPTAFTLQSEKGVAVTCKGAAEVSTNAPNIPQANAGIVVDFSSKGGFVINAPQTYEPTIEDIAALETQILDLFKGGGWNKEWVVIAKLMTAPSAAILVSRSSEAKIELAAQAQLPAGSTVQLGHANVKFSVCYVSGDIIDLKDARNVTPFFQLLGLKRRWFQEDTVKLFRADTFSGDPMDAITATMARQNEKIARSLYLDLVWEPVTETETTGE